jgi:mRNA interferase YafQ
MRTPIYTKKFQKELEKCRKRGWNTDEIKQVMTTLISDIPLDNRHRNHLLSGDYEGYWDCHIRPDWLLLYKLDDRDNTIVFARIGTHCDLF